MDATERNAILLEHWPWIQAYLASILKRSDGDFYDEALSHVSERIVKCAIYSHRPDKGTLRAHLRRHIRGAVQDLLRQKQHHIAKEQSSVQHARDMLSHQLGRRATDREVAEELLISEQDVIYATDKEDDLPTDWQCNPHPVSKEPWNTSAFEHMTFGLKAKSRHLLWLYYVQQNTMAEISLILHVSEYCISNRLKELRIFFKEKDKKNPFLSDM
jgi:RNA polymerase sigma factor (sigma-70 family)